MPTFNQLVRKGRNVLADKSTAPALQKGFNSKKKVVIDQSCPQKRGVCTERLPELSSQTETKLQLTSLVSDTIFRSTPLFLSEADVLRTSLV